MQNFPRHPKIILIKSCDEPKDAKNRCWVHWYKNSPFLILNAVWRPSGWWILCKIVQPFDILLSYPLKSATDTPAFGGVLSLSAHLQKCIKFSENPE